MHHQHHLWIKTVSTRRFFMEFQELEPTNNDNLSNEFADVIITILIVAEWMNVDIEQATKNRNYQKAVMHEA